SILHISLLEGTDTLLWICYPRSLATVSHAHAVVKYFPGSLQQRSAVPGRPGHAEARGVSSAALASAPGSRFFPKGKLAFSGKVNGLAQNARGFLGRMESSRIFGLHKVQKKLRLAMKIACRGQLLIGSSCGAGFLKVLYQLHQGIHSHIAQVEELC